MEKITAVILAMLLSLTACSGKMHSDYECMGACRAQLFLSGGSGI